MDPCGLQQHPANVGMHTRISIAFFPLKRELGGGGQGRCPPAGPLPSLLVDVILPHRLLPSAPPRFHCLTALAPTPPIRVPDRLCASPADVKVWLGSFFTTGLKSAPNPTQISFIFPSKWRCW